jgi:ArsR family transcriptional regulator, arsenate/arsenite/antimonite-responsive transcriptional repressor
MKSQCSNCFRSLGVGSRAEIYGFLEVNGEKNVNSITEFIKLKQPTVSYHLSGMLKTGLLNKKIKGKEVFYSVNKTCPHDKLKCVVY